jgi:parvulin-like peptidyl-prolyl isomerase
MNPLRRPLSIVAVLVAVLSLTACAETERPAATVEESAIATDEVAATANVFEAVFGLQQQPCGQVDQTSDTDTQEAACNRFALSQLIVLRLAEGYAIDAGITVSDEAIEAEIGGLETNLGVDVVADALEANEVTREDLGEVARAFLLEAEVRRALALEEIGEDGLLARYEERRSEYTIVQVDHILVTTEEEARKAYEQVTAPGATREDFLALAAEVSQDPSVAQNGGSLGSAYASQYVKEFADAALALEPGEISEPVRTDFGWHVIHLVDEEVTPFEEVRDDLLGDEGTTAFADWVRALNEEGAIDVNPSFGRFDDQTLTVVRISSTDPSAATPSQPVNVVPADG